VEKQSLKNYQNNITMEKLNISNGDNCEVIAGTHKGKSGIVRDKNTSKTGHITITVEQKNGVRFKTLGRNVRVISLSKK